jgi:hypothetical protein
MIKGQLYSIAVAITTTRVIAASLLLRVLPESMWLFPLQEKA